MKKKVLLLVLAVAVVAAIGVGITMNSDGVHHFLFWSSVDVESNGYIMDLHSGEILGTTTVRMDGTANFAGERFRGTILVEDYPIPEEEAEKRGDVHTATKEDRYRLISYTGAKAEATSEFSDYAYNVFLIGPKGRDVVIQVAGEDGCWIICAENEEEAAAVMDIFFDYIPTVQVTT